MKKINRRVHGWAPDVPDQRDYKYERTYSKRLPSKVDLREQFFPAWDQGNLGSCTAQAIAAHCMFNDIKDHDPEIVLPSRLFIYYNERALEGTIHSDAGAQIRNGIKVVAKMGYCPEDMWPYRVSKFKLKPSLSCYQQAKKEKITIYKRVKQDLRDLKSCLAEGFSIIFGFSVYESIHQLKVERTGKISMPKKNEKLEGGHAVLAVGYNDKEKAFIFRNSWGRGWGQEGHGFLPYDFILNEDLADDFWTIRFKKQK